MATKKSDNAPLWLKPRRKFLRLMVSFFIHLLGWIGMAVVFYACFSFFFDTPTEYKLKRGTLKLRKEYKELTQRYDSLMIVLDNLSERDRNVFQTLFESDPYDLEAKQQTDNWLEYEKLLTRSTKDLGRILAEKTAVMDKDVTALTATFDRMLQKIADAGPNINLIPAIQPVINRDLTLLTASYGMRIHPFYRSLASHQGVDFTVPEGSRVFATADGVVADVTSRNTTAGTTIILDHGFGYQTVYNHLSKTNVKKNDKVRRGDIIALTGNTGLSLSPHLHYEVRHSGLRVDPIHYFFMELTPDEYKKIMQIAQSGMQSFD